MSMADARALATKVLTMDSAKDIYALCDAFYRDRVRADETV
jgi:hypothetical protein